MGNFLNWRPSVNVSVAPPNDPLRREMMMRAIFEPDDRRVARGAGPMPDEARNAVGRYLSNKDALGPASTNWFGEQRVLPPQAFGTLPAPQQSLSALGQSFMQRNDAAMSDAAIGDVLQGRAAAPCGFLGALGSSRRKW